jgi:hypothetical protein
MTASQDVTTAIGLGWQFADLYAEAQVRGDDAPQDPPDLPGLSALSWRQLLELRFHQVSSGLSRLTPAVAAGGLSLDDLRDSVATAARNPGTAGSRWPEAGEQREAESAGHGAEPAGQAGDGAGAPEPAAIRRQVLAWHVQVLETLTAADATVGKAYGLGRALADLTMRPASGLAALQADFSGRVDTIKGWLNDLRSVLPDHAGAVVGASLDSWQRWIESTGDAAAIWQEPAGWQDPLHPAASRSLVAETLFRQGNLWCAVLTGEKQAVDLLSADEYVSASEALIQRLGMIGRRFWAQYWLGISLGVLALAAAVTGLVLVPSGTAGGLGALGAILAATGITWKGVGSTLGTAIRKAEPALWGAQIDLVATAAITLLPGTSAVTLDVSKPAGLSRSKEPPRLMLHPPAGQAGRPGGAGRPWRRIRPGRARRARR